MDSINGFECQVQIPTGLFKLSDALPPLALNVGLEPDWIVGFASPLPVPSAGDRAVTLITFTFLATDLTPYDIFLAPSSVPETPGWLAIVDGSLVDDNVHAAGPATDDFTVPAFRVNSSGPVSVSVPVFDPEPGSYFEPQSVTITSATTGATIRYTLDGSTPTEISNLYSGPISISVTSTLQAKAWKTDRVPSSVRSGLYEINATPVAPPTFDPPGGVFATSQSVNILCATTGATIRYTLDGTKPTEFSTVYSNPIDISETSVLKAQARKLNMTPSEIGSAIYNFSPDSRASEIGIYTDESADINSSSFEGVGQLTAYLVLTNPVNYNYAGTGTIKPINSISGFECQIRIPENLTKLSAVLPLASLNVGVEPDWIVGFGRIQPVPPSGSRALVLITFEFLVETLDPLDIYLAPTSVPSIPGLLAIVDGSLVDDNLQEAYPASGDFGLPVFRINHGK